MIEFCAENYTDIERAIKAGVSRIELCDHLSCGGTTPSYGVVKKTRAMTRKHGVALVVIVRPRAGDFCYSADEVDIMKEDIKQFNRLDVDGVVLGALTKDCRLDMVTMKQLVEVAETDVVFHMAFDDIISCKKEEAIDQCVQLGIKRILLHGSRVRQSVYENKEEINDLIAYGRERIEFIVGKGIKRCDVPQLKEVIHTDQFHGTQMI